MANRQVTSREYKLMLNTDRFEQRGRGAEVFLGLLRFLVGKQGGEVTGADVKEKRRVVSFLDTPELALRRAGFSLRVREEKADDFRLNLKYRAADRYLAAAQDVSSPQGGDPEFEEDVLPPFVSKFSSSNTVKLTATPDLDDARKLAAMFPGLAGLKLGGDTPVKTANDFKAVEVERSKFCDISFGGQGEIEAELSFWYLTADEAGWPLLAEFSFGYKAAGGDGLEDYPAATVEGANRLFASLQNQPGWVSAPAVTKTAFALDAL